MPRSSSRYTIRIYNYLRRMSLKRRITLSILAAFVMTLPAVAVSLFYFTSLIEDIGTIIDRDVALGRAAGDISLSMLEIRRHERSYRLFGGTADELRINDGIAQTRAMLENARDIVAEEDKAIITRLSNHLSIYENSFESLVLYISDHPPEDRINQIRSQLSGRMTEFQKNYRDTLSKLDDLPAAERDSVIARATESFDTFSLDYLFDEDSSDARGAQPSYFRENLDTSARIFLETADDLADKSWRNMALHRRESRLIEARTNRNIVTVLIMTAIVCVFMITILPRRIVKPIASLNRLLKKAGEGDFTAIARFTTNDEIGDLAQSYNHVIDRVQVYDKLKSQKIASQKRLIERLIENLPQPVAIVRPDFTVSYYNNAFADLFDDSIPAITPEGGLVIEKHEIMRDFIEQLQERLSAGSAHFIFDITNGDGETVTLKGRTVLNKVMKLDSIVITGLQS